MHGKTHGVVGHGKTQGCHLSQYPWLLPWNHGKDHYMAKPIYHDFRHGVWLLPFIYGKTHGIPYSGLDTRCFEPLDLSSRPLGAQAKLLTHRSLTLYDACKIWGQTYGLIVMVTFNASHLVPTKEQTVGTVTTFTFTSNISIAELPAHLHSAPNLQNVKL